MHIVYIPLAFPWKVREGGVSWRSKVLESDHADTVTVNTVRPSCAWVRSDNAQRLGHRRHVKDETSSG